MQVTSIFDTLKQNMGRYRTAMASGQVSDDEKANIQKALTEAEAAIASKDAAKAGSANTALSQIPLQSGSNANVVSQDEEDEGGFSTVTTQEDAGQQDLFSLDEGLGGGETAEEPPTETAEPGGIVPEAEDPIAEEETAETEEEEAAEESGSAEPGGIVPEPEDPANPEPEPVPPVEEPEPEPVTEEEEEAEEPAPEPPTVEQPEPEPPQEELVPEPTVEEPEVAEPPPPPPAYKLDGPITQNNRGYAWNIPPEIADIYYLWDANSKHTNGIPEEWRMSEEGKQFIEANPTALMAKDRGIIAVPKKGKEGSPYLKAFQPLGAEAKDPAEATDPEIDKLYNEAKSLTDDRLFLPDQSWSDSSRLHYMPLKEKKDAEGSRHPIGMYGVITYIPTMSANDFYVINENEKVYVTRSRTLLGGKTLFIAVRWASLDEVKKGQASNGDGPIPAIGDDKIQNAVLQKKYKEATEKIITYAKDKGDQMSDSRLKKDIEDVNVILYDRFMRG
jgi:hypothetical protein